MPENGNSIAIQGLIPEDASLQRVASVLGMAPEKLVRRLGITSLSITEKMVFLTLAPDLHMLPESFEKLLVAYRGDSRITPEFMERKQIGPNLISNRFGDLADYLEQAIEIRNLYEVPISYSDLGVLLMEYGSGTAGVLELVDSSLDEFVQWFGISKATRHIQIAKCVSFICKVIIPDCRMRGRIAPHSTEEFQEYGRSVRERTPR